MKNEIIDSEEYEEIDLEENAGEIVKNILIQYKKDNKMTKEQLDKLNKEANDTIEFLKLIDTIELEGKTKVIFVDGTEELIFEDNEFYLCDTIDKFRPRKKLKKKEAQDKYIEYFIRYILNPVIEQRNKQGLNEKEVATINLKSKDKIVEKVEKAPKANSSKQEVKKDTKTKNTKEQVKAKEDNIEIDNI